MSKYLKAKYIQQFTRFPNSGPFIRPRERKKEIKREREKERKKGRKKERVLIEFGMCREIFLTNLLLCYIRTL